MSVKSTSLTSLEMGFKRGTFELLILNTRFNNLPVSQTLYGFDGGRLRTF